MKVLGVMEIKLNQFRFMAGNHSLPTALVAQLSRATLYYGFERGSVLDLYSWYVSGELKKLKVKLIPNADYDSSQYGLPTYSAFSSCHLVPRACCPF